MDTASCIQCSALSSLPINLLAVGLAWLGAYLPFAILARSLDFYNLKAYIRILFPSQSHTLTGLWVYSFWSQQRLCIFDMPSLSGGALKPLLLVVHIELLQASIYPTCHFWVKFYLPDMAINNIAREHVSRKRRELLEARVKVHRRCVYCYLDLRK